MPGHETFPPSHPDGPRSGRSFVYPPLPADEYSTAPTAAGPGSGDSRPTMAQAGVNAGAPPHGRSPGVTFLRWAPLWTVGLVLLIVAVLVTLARTEVGKRAPAVTTPQCRWHTVTAGETLSGISVQYGVSVEAIARSSGITDVDTISAGQRLCIPPANAQLAVSGPRVEGEPDFVRFALPYAKRASAETGWPVSVILAQWGLEHGWQLPGYTGYNFGNSGAVPNEPAVPGTDAPGSPAAFAFAPTPEDGLRIYLHVAALDYYTEIAPAAARGGPDAAARALGESPWDAAHYTTSGDPGSSLLAVMRDFNLYQYDQ